jgi:hypothetical protein
VEGSWKGLLPLLATNWKSLMDEMGYKTQQSSQTYVTFTFEGRVEF